MPEPRTPDITEQVETFLLPLAPFPAQPMRAILDAMDVLEEVGPALGRPLVDQIKLVPDYRDVVPLFGNHLKELRPLGMIPPGQEAAAAESARALRDALALSELRRERGVTQADLAEILGKSQGNVSELERRDDVYLSSLREYVEALGGRLEISAIFDEERRPLAIG